MRCNSVTLLRQLYIILGASATVLYGVAMLGLASGCGKSFPDGIFPVSGRITLDGKPLADASITFISDQAQVPGYVDADGHYELKPGAAAGEYRVVISKLNKAALRNIGLDPGAAGRGGKASGTSEAPKQLVPARFSDPKQTKLFFVVVSPGTTRADFDMSSQ